MKLDPRFDQFLFRNLSITEGIEWPRFLFISSKACDAECCRFCKPAVAA